MGKEDQKSLFNKVLNELRDNQLETCGFHKALQEFGVELRKLQPSQDSYLECGRISDDYIFGRITKKQFVEDIKLVLESKEMALLFSTSSSEYVLVRFVENILIALSKFNEELNELRDNQLETCGFHKALQEFGVELRKLQPSQDSYLECGRISDDYIFGRITKKQFVEDIKLVLESKEMALLFSTSSSEYVLIRFVENILIALSKFVENNMDYFFGKKQCFFYKTALETKHENLNRTVENVSEENREVWNEVASNYG